MKRLLSCTSSEMLKMDGQELKQAILASEGRTVMTETVVAIEPLLGDLTNAELAVSFGSDMVLLNCFDCNNFICLTGNPGVGVSNHSICEAIKEAKKYFKGLIIAGKMHAAGIDEPIVDMESIKEFIEAGADVILMPAVNTVPGLSEQEVTKACRYIKAHGALSLSAIGTSQEGADEGTIREIALLNKRCGIDIQHIGDAGFCGIALPENIMALSIAIRGKRHTYHKIASSINR